MDTNSWRECKTNWECRKIKNVKLTVVTIEQSRLNMQAVPLDGSIF